MDSEILILGSGIIGSAVAYELSQRGAQGVHALDADLEGGLSSTERNAGGVRHLWQRRINMELAKTSIDFFHEIGDEIGFQKTGYLWLYSKEEKDLAHDVLSKTQERHLDYELWDVSEIKKHYPFIDKTDDLSCALFGKRDGLVNANALKNYFRNQARNKGCTFHNFKWVTQIEEKKDHVELEVATLHSLEEANNVLQNPGAYQPTETKTWKTKKLVLCTGAWTHLLQEQSGVQIHTKPFRRQIAMFSAENFDMAEYGMVVDSSRVYFHPEGGNILAGLVLKEEKEGLNFKFDPDFFESHIWPALYERSSQLESLKYVSGWGGLYSYTPDTTGILGHVNGMNHIYEAHSFTGRGVMQSYGVGVAVSELLLEGKFSSIDAQCLSSTRFQDPNLFLREELHI